MNQVPLPLFHLSLSELSPEFGFGRIIENEGINLAPRLIKDFEFVLIIKGSGSYRILDKTIQYKPGALILTPPHIVHEYRCTELITYYYLHFDFFKGFAERFKTYALLDRGYSGMRFLLDNQPMPFYGEKTGTLFKYKLLKCIEYQHDPFRQDHPSRPYNQKALLMDLIAEWHREAVDQNSPAMTTPFKASLAHMHAHLNRGIRIAELAELEGLSAPHYIVKFKKRFGRTPLDYLNRARIRKAQTLMADPKVKLYDVALAVGLSDPLYFSRLFRSIVGVPPREYRKQLGL